MVKQGFGYEENVTCFLQEYLLFPGDAYNPNGTLTNDACRFGLKMLLNEGVFESPQELRSEAFEKYGILLPDALFGG